MVTVVESTISLSGSPDYSTLQAWEDAAPADLVAADVIWKGVIQQATDNFSGTTVMLTVAGSTVDTAHYKELTVAAGASFIDNIAAGALRYNEANGASITSSVAGDTISIIPNDFYLHISRLQIANTNNNGNAINGWRSSIIDKCILETKAWGGVTVHGEGKILNSLIVNRRASKNGYLLTVSSGGKAINCTFVKPDGLPRANYAINSVNSPSETITNCAFFGADAVDNNGLATFATCFTDILSVPAGCATTPYSTSAGAFFENISDGTHDYRIKHGSALINTGTDDPVYGATDILGTPRVAGYYDVGCYELDQFGGSAFGSSSTAGDLSTAIPLDGASIVVSTAAGSINVPIKMAAVASAQITASGDLATSITLTGAAVSASLANAGIGTSILLAGGASGESFATGAMNAQIQLSADAIAQALAAAGLSSDIQLGGDAGGDSTATGELTSINVPLSGDAIATVTGAGDLNTQINLDGAALNAVSGTGSLTASIQFSGDAAALVMAGADLATQISLNAAALGQALASAELSGGVLSIKPDPRRTAKATWRNYNVAV